jgi:hypothetical protein
MKSQTKDLRSKLLSLEESEDRLKVLKNQYEGDTAYIVAAGPSLKNYSTDYLNEFFSNKLCLPIKQTYNFLGEVADFHLLNFCNFAPYDWSNNQSIITWAIFEQFHPQMIFDNNLEADLFIPIIRNSPQTGGGVGPNKMIHSVAEKGDFDSLKLDHPNLGFNQPWGPGIMYEIAIPLAIYLGCKKIVTVGWDIGDLSSFEKGIEDDTQRVFQEHFYGEEHNKIVYAKTSMGPREILSVSKSTKGMYYWLKNQGIEWEMVSDRNPGYEGIKRISL